MDKCKFCTDRVVANYGECTSLEIDAKRQLISAYGEGEAHFDIYYCPMCGRKLGD